MLVLGLKGVSYMSKISKISNHETMRFSKQMKMCVDAHIVRYASVHVYIGEEAVCGCTYIYACICMCI